MYLKLSLLLVFCLATLQPLRAQTDNRTEIHVAFITSFGGEYDSSGVIPAVQLATELINNRTDLLTGHELVIELIEDRNTSFQYANSNCSRDSSLKSFLRQITTGVNKVALFGCGCSSATEPVAEISGFWNITHMSYASSSDTLSNRQRFPNFWRTYPQESNLAFSVVAIMKEYNWTVLKIITEEDSIFMGSTETLLSVLEEAGITVNQNGTTRFTSDENLLNRTDLFQPEIRVYLLNMYSNHAREVLCAASKAKTRDSDPAFYYRGYVWITLGWYREQWWTAEAAQDPSVDCLDEDLESFLPQTFGILQANAARNESEPTDVDLTAEEFKNLYDQRLESSNYNVENTAYHAYDGLWSLTFAINSSLSELEEKGYSLEDFEYSTNARNISAIIHNQLQSTSFIGVSGSVTFDSDGTRVGTDPKIQKYRTNLDQNNCGVYGPDSIERVVIATVGDNFTYLDCEDSATVWPDGIPPDGTSKIVITSILEPIFYVYTIFASAGIIFAIVCMLFNFIFRKRKIVRLISPNLNYLIIIGAIFMYASVYGFVIPSTDHLILTIACHLRGWLQTTGYFLCFGTIVAKMWRVYYIFHHPQIQRSKRNSRSRGVKDWHLLIIVALMTSVVVIILFFVAVLGDYKPTEVVDNETPDQRTENKVLIQHRNLVCQGPGDTIWIIVSFGYILLTQVVGVILAFRTRKVKIKALNDAKYIAVIIYLTSVIITIMIICAVLLRNLMNADAATFGGLLLIFTTIVLSLVFIPKMVILYRDPKGEKIFERTYSASQPTLTHVGDNEVMDRMNELEKHTREMERRLGKYESVTPFRIHSTSFSSSIKIRSGSLNYLSPSSPTHAINPTLSLPVTPLKIPPTSTETKINTANGTSGYLTEGDRSSSASAVERTEKDKTPEQHSDDKPDQQVDIDKMP